ncbi:MAG: formylglycine-generating enzyme family protein [Thioalkalivibrionaceae bacterium]
MSASDEVDQAWDQAGCVAAAEKAAREAGVGVSFADRFLEPSSDGRTIEGPALQVIPPGRFRMGAPVSEFGSEDHERPVRGVEIDQAFALGRYLVMREEWDRFREDTGWSASRELLWPKTPRTPVFNVRRVDVLDYLAWLSDRTGQRYRLPTEAEWEYAARAGTQTAFAFGDTVSCRDVHFNSLFPYDERRERRKWYLPLCIPTGKPLEVGLFPANVWGLYDMHGNLQEWTDTPWRDSHSELRSDGTLPREDEEEWWVCKGGSWFDPAVATRSAARRRRHIDEMDTNIGFRVLREL